MLEGPVVVRRMRLGEAAQVGALTLAAYDAYGSIQGDYRRYLADPLERLDGSSGLFVAEVEGRVVGTVTYVEPQDREWEGRAAPEGDAGFRVLAVDPTVEGLGVGGLLVERCVALARSRRRARIVIVSMGWMHRAHHLYLRRGFVRRPDLDVTFPSGVGVVFQLDLHEDAAARFPPPGPVPGSPLWFEDVWDR